MRWWQSIRWRLALGSMLIVLLATAILAASTIFAIAYYYNKQQTISVPALAVEDAQTIGELYAKIQVTPSHPNRLGAALISAVSTKRISIVNNTLLRSARGEEYEYLVISTHGRFVSPALKYISSKEILASVVTAHARNCVVPAGDVKKICSAIQGATGNITPTTDQFGQNPFFPRTFTVAPITADGTHNTQAIAALVVLTPANALSVSYVWSIAEAVLLVALVVAFIAAIGAIIFSRTITRPLAKLTNASRVMASGDYSAQVTIKAHGEIGELAHSFNEMAAQLSRDVDELRQQEMWRRELIMSITHDLATPLTAIAGLGESLVDGINQSRDEYEDTGRIIVRETQRLRRLVKDLHVMAKVEAGALKPQLKELRLAALVDEILAVLATEFERAEVEPRNAIPYNLLIGADADMLTRVFSNLFANAIRHTPPGGNVTAEAKVRDNLLLVSVADTGEGIPPEALSLIFERFYRADSARQSTTGGSGLGLAIVRAIVEAHGGTVHAENIPTGGARIVFTLPYVEITANNSTSSRLTIEETKNTAIEETVADTLPLRLPLPKRQELQSTPPRA